MRRPLIALALTGAALAGCGGDDSKEDVERVIRDYAKAANDRDAEHLCNDLVTAGFAEDLTLVQDDEDEAREQCKKLFEATQAGLTIEVREIKKVEIDGDDATAVVTIVTSAEPTDTVFKLEKEDGDFRIAGTGAN